MKGDLTMCSEALLKQVRSYQVGSGFLVLSFYLTLSLVLYTENGLVSRIWL